MHPHIETFTAEIEKVLHFLSVEYAKLQTGRASAALVENVEVTAYGQKQPLKSVAGITVQDARTIVVQPWDAGVLNQVEVALTEADLGAAPQNDGSVIRINLPPMTEERREQMVKLAHQLAEEARISVRQLRQTAHDKIRDEEKDEDVRYTQQENLQKEVDKANGSIEEHMKQKEEEIRTV